MIPTPISTATRAAAGWGGISSLRLGLTAIWSQARARGHTLDDVVAWMASGPAALAGLTRKGCTGARSTSTTRAESCWCTSNRHRRTPGGGQGTGKPNR